MHAITELFAVYFVSLCKGKFVNYGMWLHVCSTISGQKYILKCKHYE